MRQWRPQVVATNAVYIQSRRQAGANQLFKLKGCRQGGPFLAVSVAVPSGNLPVPILFLAGTCGPCLQSLTQGTTLRHFTRLSFCRSQLHGSFCARKTVRCLYHGGLATEIIPQFVANRIEPSVDHGIDRTNGAVVVVLKSLAFWTRQVPPPATESRQESEIRSDAIGAQFGHVSRVLAGRANAESGFHSVPCSFSCGGPSGTLPMMKLADESAISDVAECERFGFVRYWAIAALTRCN